MAGRGGERVQHRDGLVGAHNKLPLPLARPQPTAHPRAGFKLLRTERARRPTVERQHHRRARRAPLVVDALDAHLGALGTGVDEPQPAHLLVVPSRIEYRYLVLPRPGARNEVVHAGQEPVAGADVGQHLKLQRARKLQAPVALARRPRRTLEPLLRVAALQIVGVEVLRLAPTDGKRQRPVRHPRIVPGDDFHLAVRVGVIDDARKALTPKRVGSRGKQPDAVGLPQRGAYRHPRRRPGARSRAREIRIERKRMRWGRRVRRRGVHRVRHLRVRLLALDSPVPLVPGVPSRLRLRRAALPAPHRRAAHRVLRTQHLRNRSQSDRNEHCVRNNSARSGRHVRRRTRSPRCC